MKTLFFTLFLVFNVSLVFSQDLLKNQVPGEMLSEILIPREAYHPVPDINDRVVWENLPSEVAELYLNKAEDLLDYQWPSLPATTTLLFVRNGNRSEYQEKSFPKRSNLGILLIAELIENQGRFLDQIIDGIWSICEESYWGVPAHLKHSRSGEGLPNVEDPWVDLFAAETVNYLAWTDYLIGQKLDSISPLIRERIRMEANKRIYDPILNYRHIWMDFTFNWNPWICSNWLSSILLLEENQEKRALHVGMVLESLDNFLNAYPSDGGCDEGPGYWNAAGASLFECLEIMNLATKGQYQVFDHPKIKNIGSYIYKVQIGENRFINFADANPTIQPMGQWIYRFGKRIEDPAMMQFGAYFSGPDELIKGSFHFTRIILLLAENTEESELQAKLPLPGDVWLSEIQVMLSRDKEGSDEGLCLAAKGGHNAEAHNHNDVGNFIVYYNGKPLIIDAGRGTYTAKFFSKDRYSLWMTNSAHHNVPLINDMQQPEGAQYKAGSVNYSKGRNKAQLSMNIAGAYPEKSGVNKWIRTITHQKSKKITIREEVEFDQKGFFSEVFMTVAKPDISKNGIIRLSLDDNPDIPEFFLSYDAALLKASFRKMPLDLTEDEGIKSNWQTDIYRIELKCMEPVRNMDFTLELKTTL